MQYLVDEVIEVSLAEVGREFEIVLYSIPYDIETGLLQRTSRSMMSSPERQLRLAVFLKEDTMSKEPFLPSEFVPTKFSSATDKADFGNALLNFLDANCAQQLFTSKLYHRLSKTFGHIAHYDRNGFYDTWFTGASDRAAFVEKILCWPCHGNPEFTFSDVEHAIQRVIRERNYLARFVLTASEAVRNAEERARAAGSEASN